LKAGFAALPATARGAVVLLGDMPLIKPEVIDLLIDGFAKRPDASAVVPLHRGERGNPVLIARALFPRVMTLAGDTGARALLKAADGAVVEIETGDDAVTFDVDTPDLLRP
jgi:molybdenum cofactor cytidylyltransferase